MTSGIAIKETHLEHGSEDAPHHVIQRALWHPARPDADLSVSLRNRREHFHIQPLLAPDGAVRRSPVGHDPAAKPNSPFNKNFA